MASKAARAGSPMTDAQLVSMLDQGIVSSICFENDAKHDRREKALEYHDGVMDDLPAEEGRSSAVSRDVSDTVETMLPGLLRVFDGTDRVVVYSATSPAQVEAAKQATDYVNHVWQNETEGYLALACAIHDALTVRNGIIKVYWDDSVEWGVEDLRNLSEDQTVFLLQQPGVELVAALPRQETLPGPQGLVPATFYDLRIRRQKGAGRLVVEAVPPENFGVAKGTKLLERTKLCWEKVTKTRSDLLADGYDREKVMALAGDASFDAPTSEAELTRQERDDEGAADTAESPDRSLDEIEVHECYPLVDMDGDGMAERWRVVKAGNVILDKEPWPDDLPYVDVVAMFVPHRWMGKSVADSTMDIMRIKTALLRGLLDNIYAVNRPQREVVESNIIDPDEVLSPKFGGVIRVKSANSVQDLPTTFMGEASLASLNYADQVIQKRTGVSGATASLDPTALEPQTATAEQLEHDAGYARIELIARNMAKLGLPRLFLKILRIIIRNQDRPRTIPLRGKWVDFDPRAWDASMTAKVSIGQGTGSRERDLAMLGGVRKSQEMIMERLGPNNPIVPPSKYIATLHKSVEAAGLTNPEEYFGSVTDEQFAAWMQSQPPKEDPKVSTARQLGQAKLQLEGAKSASQAQERRQKSAEDAQTRQTEAASKLQQRREELAAEAGMKREAMERDFALRVEEMDREYALKQQEMHLEATLDVGKLALDAQRGPASVGGRGATNIPRNP